MLTFGLRESLAPGGRVVLVTSGGAYAQRLDVDDPEFARATEGTYSGTAAYARTKRMQLVLAPLWARELAADDVTVSSMHPGWADTPGVVDALPGFHRLTGPILRDAAQGADTSVWLVAAEPAPESGLLWHDRRPRPEHYTRRTRETETERQAMWAWVREQTGIDL